MKHNDFQYTKKKKDTKNIVNESESVMEEKFHSRENNEKRKEKIEIPSDINTSPQKYTNIKEKFESKQREAKPKWQPQLKTIIKHEKEGEGRERGKIWRVKEVFIVFITILYFSIHTLSFLLIQNICFLLTMNFECKSPESCVTTKPKPFSFRFLTEFCSIFIQAKLNFKRL